jgi:hypothetical protein
MSRTIPSFIRSRIALALALAAVPTLQAQQAPAGRPSAADRLEEIVVTARRREESLQDVPASIAVVSGSDLEAVGAQGYEDFVRMVPGLFMGGTSNRSQINFAIRGISTSTVGGANQPTISVYVDEFQIMDPFSAVGVPNIHLTDIDPKCCAGRRARCSVPARCPAPCASCPTSRAPSRCRHRSPPRSKMSPAARRATASTAC